ncbi:MAG: hypothetical protein K2G83_06900 [Ruminococcus sp.]|nr:hypothetical protein [Ruminococcus sp.]
MKIEIFRKIASSISFILFAVSFWSCKNSISDGNTAVSETLQVEEETVITVGNRAITADELFFYVKYYAIYARDDMGDFDNWTDEFEDGFSYQNYVMNGAVQWLKYDEAVKLKAEELECILTDEDRTRIDSQWTSLVEEYNSEESLLEEMSEYYCNEKLYKDMIGGFLLSDKCCTVMYGDNNDMKAFEDEIQSIAQERINVEFSEFYNSINLNETKYF